MQWGSLPRAAWTPVANGANGAAVVGLSDENRGGKMTGMQDASRSLTRRNFLKVGAAGAAGLAAAGAMTGCDAWLGAASQQAA